MFGSQSTSNLTPLASTTTIAGAAPPTARLVGSRHHHGKAPGLSTRENIRQDKEYQNIRI